MLQSQHTVFKPKLLHVDKVPSCSTTIGTAVKTCFEVEAASAACPEASGSFCHNPNFTPT